MSFPDLTEHIQQTFSAFSGADEYEQQLTLWCYRRAENLTMIALPWAALTAEQRRTKKQRWRDKHPDKARAQWRRSTQAYRARKRAERKAA